MTDANAQAEVSGGPPKPSGDAPVRPRYYVGFYDFLDGWGEWGFWPGLLLIPSPRRGPVVTGSMPTSTRTTGQSASIGASSTAR
jgi:hypothetical protein